MPDERVEREIVLPVVVGDVWRALTDPHRLSRWFGARARFSARTGARASFAWPDGTTRDAVLEVLEEPRLLVLRWLPFERDVMGAVRQRDPSTVHFVLTPVPGGTRLEIREHRLGERTQACGSLPADTATYRAVATSDRLDDRAAFRRTLVSAKGGDHGRRL